MLDFYGWKQDSECNRLETRSAKRNLANARQNFPSVFFAEPAFVTVYALQII